MARIVEVGNRIGGPAKEFLVEMFNEGSKEGKKAFQFWGRKLGKQSQIKAMRSPVHGKTAHRRDDNGIC